MARRRRSSRRQSQTGVQLVQILGLGVILLIILLFRDEVADNAGKFFGVMGSDDVQVTLESDAGTPASATQNDADSPAAKPDAGSP